MSHLNLAKLVIAIKYDDEDSRLPGELIASSLVESSIEFIVEIYSEMFP